jgi:hypothetical protein
VALLIGLLIGSAPPTHQSGAGLRGAFFHFFAIDDCAGRRFRGSNRVVAVVPALAGRASFLGTINTLSESSRPFLPRLVGLLESRIKITYVLVG